ALARIVEEIPGLAHLQILDAPVPLGHPNQPDARCALLAPDAPGKARLAPEPPDPWRSPLAQAAMFEIVRHRALRRARAVLRLDPEDFLLPPGDGGTVFDAAAESGSYLKFRGIRAYPWQTTGDAAELADHACRRFDGAASESIWCATPAMSGRWRAYRATIRPPDPVSAAFGFVRMMGLRHPALTPAQMAPKSSLIADRRIITLVEGLTGRSPSLPPQPAEVAPAEPFSNDRVLVVTTMKNEGPFLLEWLAYHRSIGVTDTLVYTNDCADGTDAMFDRLQEMGLVEHRPNPYRETGDKPQHAALADAQHQPVAQAADWVICMDVDEYINVHAGDGHLRDLFAAVPDATMIALTWRLFGNGDISDYEDRWITEQHVRCAPQVVRKPHQAWGFKTLFRPLPHYKKFGVHRPKGLRPEYLPAIRFVNGSGAPMPEPYLRTGWRSSLSSYGYGLATLNHYAVRSAESFLVKRDRGRVNHVDRDQGLAYWFRMNHNAEVDRSILARLPAARDAHARLMADPTLARLHAKAVAWHRRRIAELMARPDYAALFDEITGSRLRRLSTELHRFGTRVFLQGPDAIPDDPLEPGGGTVTD
ncbi:MAG: glycosyltransferase family 2 protein, partial [Pseudomonadota bacterium]